MSAVEKSEGTDGVERIPAKPRQQIVSDELRRLRDALLAACPPEAEVSFQFENALHVHIDVRNVEHMTMVEALLPGMGAGLFSDLQRGDSPHRPFFHRITARVDR